MEVYCPSVGERFSLHNNNRKTRKYAEEGKEGKRAKVLSRRKSGGVHLKVGKTLSSVNSSAKVAQSGAEKITID